MAYGEPLAEASGQGVPPRRVERLRASQRRALAAMIKLADGGRLTSVAVEGRCRAAPPAVLAWLLCSVFLVLLLWAGQMSPMITVLLLGSTQAVVANSKMMEREPIPASFRDVWWLRADRLHQACAVVEQVADRPANWRVRALLQTAPGDLTQRLFDGICEDADRRGLILEVPRGPDCYAHAETHVWQPSALAGYGFVAGERSYWRPPGALSHHGGA